MKKWFLSMMVAVSSLCTAVAQNAARSVSFTVIGWGDEIQGISYLQSGELKPLVIPSWSRSSRYEYRGEPRLRFFRGGDPKAPPVATVDLSPGVSRYTILFANGETACQAFAIPDDALAIPPGKAYVVNASPDEVQLRYNKSTTIRMKPREAKLLSDVNKKVLSLEMAYADNNRWVRAGNRYVVLPPDEQTFIFYLKSDSDFFKTADGVSEKGPQILVMRQPAKDGPTQH